MMLPRSIPSTLLLLCLPVGLSAQRVTTSNEHLWISFMGDHRCTGHWSLHTEAHVRQAEWGRTPQQLLLRPAVNYHLNSDVVFTIGYSYYRNHRYGAYTIQASNWEHNIYQQVQFNWRAGRLSLQHRLRMEERFLAQLAPEANDRSTFSFQR